MRCDNEKYKAILALNYVKLDDPSKPESCGLTEAGKFNYLREHEPLDYMNMVKTYTMFLQYISVLSSTSLKDSYISQSDEDWQAKQHYDFLQCDLASKALRYQIHDYIMKRLHKTIFGTNRTSDIDTLV